MTDDDSAWMRLLREVFGDDAEAAMDELRRAGIDPEQLAAAAGVAGNPAMADHVMNQIRSLMAQDNGEPINWKLSHDVARGVAAEGGDPTVSSATAREFREAVTMAQLWLDAATDFAPVQGEAAVLSRAEWIEAADATWRRIVTPVATSVSTALSDLLSEGMQVPLPVAPTVCGIHTGQAEGAVARSSFGGTDMGFPLLPGGRVTLVPRSVADFSAGLDIPDEQVRLFVALREAARVRLFAAAPWLPGQLHAAIAGYASGIRIDPHALEDAMSRVQSMTPEEIQKTLTSGIFTPQPTEEQRVRLDAIEGLIALVEGWVDHVVMRAAAPHVPALPALTEMMNRRRGAGGTAEDVFARYLGLDMRPRLIRESAKLWAMLEARVGAEGRDDVWSHPDLLPTAEDLREPAAWIERRATGGGDDVDRELEDMLRSLRGPDGGADGPRTPGDDTPGA